MEQIEAELRRVKAVNRNPKQVFLGDGNAFGRRTEQLLEILELIRRYFPACQGVNTDATVTDIRKKTDEELLRLREAGLRRLYLGIESGLDDVLAFMEKEHDLAQAYREIERIKAAGLVFNAHIMTGIAGAGRGIENAEKTAEFFNRTGPERITNFSLFLHQSTPLFREIQNGAFLPADEVENLEEEKRLLECLNTDGLIYDGFHDAIEFRVRGVLPQDREKMLRKLDGAIAEGRKRARVVAFV